MDDPSAWDGLGKYDLESFNPRYFRRLKEFADLCDRKGTILFHNFHLQHALVESEAHYVDFPWRPATDMPDQVPAANAFYDVSHPLRRELHHKYIRRCLDILGDNRNVVFLIGEEYTGPLSFVEYCLDEIRQLGNGGREVRSYCAKRDQGCDGCDSGKSGSIRDGFYRRFAVLVLC